MRAEAPPVPHFAERLAAVVAGRESQVVLGLDPDPARLWPSALRDVPADGSPAQRAARAVVAHCRALIDAAGNDGCQPLREMRDGRRLSAHGRRWGVPLR